MYRVIGRPTLYTNMQTQPKKTETTLPNGAQSYEKGTISNNLISHETISA